MSGSQKGRKGAGRLQSQLWSFKLHHYPLPWPLTLALPVSLNGGFGGWSNLQIGSASGRNLRPDPRPKRTKTWDSERKLAIPSALFAGPALLAAARLSRGLPRLVSAMVPFVVRYGLGDLLRGKLARASKMQNIICD